MSEERNLPPERVAELIEKGEAQLIDVRAPEEHEAGHIAEDRHVPLEAITAEADSFDRSRPIVFYCRVGERSAMAAEAFAASGWDAYNMEGGLAAWAEQGRPLEPEDGAVAERRVIPDT